MNKAITNEVLETAVNESGWICIKSIAKDILTIDQIMKAAADVFNVPEQKLMKPGKTSNTISDIRYLYFFFCKMLTTATLYEIGFSCHITYTSVIKGSRKIEDYLHINDTLIMPKFTLLEAHLKKLQVQEYEKFLSGTNINLSSENESSK